MEKKSPSSLTSTRSQTSFVSFGTSGVCGHLLTLRDTSEYGHRNGAKGRESPRLT
jgi:hypothetical protein